MDRRLRDDRERTAVYCRFVAGMKPNEICADHAGLFADVHEVYAVLQNVLKRLRAIATSRNTWPARPNFSAGSVLQAEEKASRRHQVNLDKRPPELVEGQLLAYFEGVADDATRQRVERLLAQNSELARTHRSGWPASDTTARLGEGRATSSQELGEYALGLLPPARAADLERQLNGDSQLRREWPSCEFSGQP